ncbi:MAG: hypothetical protein ACYC2G_02090 [Gemmatimonadaceae bacterium]
MRAHLVLRRRRGRRQLGSAVLAPASLAPELLPPAALAPRALAIAGFVGGIAAGLLLASQQLHRHRRNLFSPSAYERLAALSYLRGQPSLDTLRLLHDYVGWEPRPLLRRRGFRLLRQLERTLD